MPRDPDVHREVNDLLGAYALDAVEPDEREVVRGHLDECAECRAELARLAAGVDGIAERLPAPPPRLWQRILSRIRGRRRNAG